MRKFATACAAVLVLLASASSARADDDAIPYGLRMPYRIVRGATNIALGWTEIFLRPFGEHGTESVGGAMAQGFANTGFRFIGGFYDITTFWVPDMNMMEIYPDWQGWPYLFHWS